MRAAVRPVAVGAGAFVLLGVAAALFALRHELGNSTTGRAGMVTAHRRSGVQLRGDLSHKTQSGLEVDSSGGRDAAAAATRSTHVSSAPYDQALECAPGEEATACCRPTQTHRQSPPLAASTERHREYLALCLIIKDQQEDIREWVAHHHAIGVEKIYMYDTGSEPPLNETLQDYIQEGVLEHIWWGPPGFASSANTSATTGLQHWAYRHCLKHYRARHQFIGFIDADEFIILKNRTATLPAMLRHMQAFEDFGGFVMLWVMFGTSGHVQRPDGGALQAYTKCTPGNTTHAGHIKSIVNTDYVIDLQTSHNFRYREGKYAVNEHFQRVDGPTCFGHPHLLTHDRVALHHYVLKSEEEYKQKIQRGA